MNIKLEHEWLKKWRASGLLLDSYLDGFTPEGFEQYIDWQIYWMNLPYEVKKP